MKVALASCTIFHISYEFVSFKVWHLLSFNFWWSWDPKPLFILCLQCWILTYLPIYESFFLKVVQASCNFCTSSSILHCSAVSSKSLILLFPNQVSIWLIKSDFSLLKIWKDHFLRLIKSMSRFSWLHSSNWDSTLYGIHWKRDCPESSFGSFHQSQYFKDSSKLDYQ